MNFNEAKEILQKEVNGIPADCYDETTEKFKAAVNLASQAIDFTTKMIDIMVDFALESGCASIEELMDKFNLWGCKNDKVN